MQTIELCSWGNKMLFSSLTGELPLALWQCLGEARRSSVCPSNKAEYKMLEPQSPVAVVEVTFKADPAEGGAAFRSQQKGKVAADGANFLALCRGAGRGRDAPL